MLYGTCGTLTINGITVPILEWKITLVQSWYSMWIKRIPRG